VLSARRHNPISDPYTNVTDNSFVKKKRTRDQSLPPSTLSHALPVNYLRSLSHWLIGDLSRESHIFISNIKWMLVRLLLHSDKDEICEYIKERSKKMPLSAAFSKELKGFLEKSERCRKMLAPFTRIIIKYFLVNQLENIYLEKKFN
jgi:hypothetical protein